MPFDIGTLGMQAAGQAIGAIMGIGLGGINDKRQLKQAKKLQALEIAGNKEMGEYNYQNQMRLWNDTNYSAQIGQLEKAGLNPGLIYGMGGGGGATTATQTGRVQGNSAPQGGGEIMGLMAQGAQMNLIKAQTENIEAQTAKTKAEIGNVPLTGENIQASTASLQQGVEESKARQALAEIELSIKQVEDYIKGKTQNMQIAAIETALREQTERWHIIANERKISDATIQTKVDQIKASLAETYARTKLNEEQAKMPQAQIDNMAKQIGIEFSKLANLQSETAIRQQLADFETSFGGQAAGILNNIINLLPIGKGKGGVKRTIVEHTGGANNTTTHRRE